MVRLMLPLSWFWIPEPTAPFEVYDAGMLDLQGLTRITNISTRGRVVGNSDLLTAGFVVTGNVPKRVLVRAVGPTLATFGVSDVLPDPLLAIIADGRTILANDNWGTQSNITT